MEGYQEGTAKGDTELSSEKVVSVYEKHGNCENYIKEAKYDIAVGYVLLQPFWANDAGLQFILAVQDGLRKGNGIPAANQDLPGEVQFPGWKKHFQCLIL